MKITGIALQREIQEPARVEGEEFDAALERIRLIDTETLVKLLGCCRNTAVKIGENANARVRIGRAVRWSVFRIEEYLKTQYGG